MSMIDKIYIEYLLLKEDEASFHQVLRLVQPKLLAFAVSFLKDKSLAQDVVQEALISLVKGIRKLKDHRKFHVWIYQVTRSKCLDTIRKNQKYKKDTDIDSVSDAIAQKNDIDIQFDVMMMINKLSLQHKNIIHLFYYQGFSILEIAEILQKPAGSIKSLLFDARAQLKQLIGEKP